MDMKDIYDNCINSQDDHCSSVCGSCGLFEPNVNPLQDRFSSNNDLPQGNYIWRPDQFN